MLNSSRANLFILLLRLLVLVVLPVLLLVLMLLLLLLLHFKLHVQLTRIKATQTSLAFCVVASTYIHAHPNWTILAAFAQGSKKSRLFT